MLNINLLILESPNLLDPELQAHLPDFNKILLLNKEENVGKNYFFLDDLIEQSKSKIDFFPYEFIICNRELLIKPPFTCCKII